MPSPVILVGSATAGSSDTVASGAGPSIALTGTTDASTDATGLVITFGGSPDLSNVLTDGTHVLFLNDANAGSRNFGSIVGKDDSAKTVTITTGEAFRASVSGLSWAIGGVRATINGALSVKLTNNNNSPGDCMPGWTIRLLSGHSESGALIFMRRAGSLLGLIKIEGESGAATRPVYTSSVGGVFCSTYCSLENFDLKKSGAIGSTAVQLSANCVLRNVRILNNFSVKFATGILTSSSSVVENNFIETVSGVGISIAGETRAIRNNTVTGCGTHGIDVSTSNTTRYPELASNIIYGNTGDGIRVSNTSDAANLSQLVIINNVIHANTGDGIGVSCSTSQRAALQQLLIANNQITKNSRGINFTGASITDEILANLGVRIWNNNFGEGTSSTSNTSGQANFTLTLTGRDNLAVDPGYLLAGSGQFTTGINTKGLGWPLTAIGSGIVPENRSYVDIGLQREEAGGGGGAKSYSFGV